MLRVPWCMLPIGPSNRVCIPSWTPFIQAMLPSDWFHPIDSSNQSMVIHPVLVIWSKSSDWCHLINLTRPVGPPRECWSSALCGLLIGPFNWIYIHSCIPFVQLNCSTDLSNRFSSPESNHYQLYDWFLTSNQTVRFDSSHPTNPFDWSIQSGRSNRYHSISLIHWFYLIQVQSFLSNRF